MFNFDTKRYFLFLFNSQLGKNFRIHSQGNLTAHCPISFIALTYKFDKLSDVELQIKLLF